LLTGRYQQRSGFECNHGKSDTLVYGLSLEEKTIADRLRAAGYHTGAIGKWHLGETPQFHPLERGFDEFFGFLGGGSHYLMPNGKPISGILRNREPVLVTSYLTDAFSEEAVSFIEKNQKSPWFLYLAFNAPHGPWEAPEKYLSRFPDVSDAPVGNSKRGCPNKRVYAAMLSALDDGVGSVLQALKKTGQDQRTLVVFLSDNGAPLHVARMASNAPLRGEKGDLFEGGVRVPFFVEWPGHVPTGVTIKSPVSSLDLLPTFLSAAGQPVPAEARLDGENLLPVLTSGKAPEENRTLYWIFRMSDQNARHTWAIRDGKWKFLRGPVRLEDGNFDRKKGPQTALYDIETDIHEDRDLSLQNPEKRSELVKKLDAWIKELQPPAWGPAKGEAAPTNLE
jgi:arylsulfatase A-like enzyme